MPNFSGRSPPGPGDSLTHRHNPNIGIIGVIPYGITPITKLRGRSGWSRCTEGLWGIRTKGGASAWLAVRSYLATVMKNGVNPLEFAEEWTIRNQKQLV
jgi:hypothetical protein